MQNTETLAHQIALSLIPNIGPVTAKSLIAYVGDVGAIFKEKQKTLQKIPGIGSVLAQNIATFHDFGRAEEELKFIEKEQITPLFYLDDDYPSRLKNCLDAPLLLFTKGNTQFETSKVVAIVGTRNATSYGIGFCESIVAEMAQRGNYLVVSGLAYGIDIAAHKACLQQGLPTVGILAHGLNKVYPQQHRQYAEKMLQNGGLATDFVSSSKIDRQNFLRRNRIIAGLSDATIVVESAEKGGALVTADIADSYNRDVFALPGRNNDAYSKGCNKLIRENKAVMIESIADLEYVMGWEKTISATKAVQRTLFVNLTNEEQMVSDALNGNDLFIDHICQQVGMPMGRVSSILLSLEFKGMVKSLPGKIYRLA